MVDMTVILTSIKKLLGGIDASETHFDPDILMHINSVFFILTQLGVGPKEGFLVSETSLWTDFLAGGIKLELVKSYVYLKVKLLFDPPLSSAMVAAMERQATEAEWRIQVAVDPVLVIAPVTTTEGGESVA